MTLLKEKIAQKDNLNYQFNTPGVSWESGILHSKRYQRNNEMPC